MDEIQVAAKKDQTIYKTFEQAGLLNKSRLYENDIKIIEYTATPDGTIYELMKWGSASEKIIAEPGDGYVSSYDLFSSGRVKQYKELCGYDKETGNVDEELVNTNINEIKDDIDKYLHPRYHIIRTKHSTDQTITIENFKRVFGMDNYNFETYDGESERDEYGKKVDINKKITVEPTKHTFIFIKEMLRYAKTLMKRYVGILYDRYTPKPDDSTIIQGLIGRDTGYDNNGVSICYTNIDSIIRYEELWLSHFENTSVKWNSKTTTIINGTLLGKNTFNDPQLYVGFEGLSPDTVKEELEPIIDRFTTFNEAKEYYKTTLKHILGKKDSCRGPNPPKANKDGYYEQRIRTSKRVYSCDEIYRERRCNINNGSGYGFRACYRDVNNKETLEWWYIYYI